MKLGLVMSGYVRLGQVRSC